MTYLLIAVIVLMALSPLLHFVPSKRQRELARLRERAAIGGLFVEFRDLPGSEHERQSASRSERQVIYYGLRMRPTRGKQQRSGAWRKREGEWMGLSGSRMVPPLLVDLPAEILAASVDNSSCGLYWREQGDASTVDQIIAALNTWSEQFDAQ